MEKFIQLFEEFMMKAIVMTENIIALPVDEEKLESFTSNRERLLQIVDKLSQDIDWNTVSPEQRNELSRQIDYMKKLDEQLLVKLQTHQNDVRKELEQTHRQNESIKGYNLNDVK